MESELRQAIKDLGNAGIVVNLRYYVTADDEFVEGSDHEQIRDFSSNSSHDIEKEGEDATISAAARSSVPPASSEGPNVIQANKLGNVPPIGPSTETSNGLSTAVNDKHHAYPPPPPISTLHTGRPDIHVILKEAQSKAKGEVGVAVCGPVGLASTTRRSVAQLESTKSGKGIYLHAESFGW